MSLMKGGLPEYEEPYTANTPELHPEVFDLGVEELDISIGESCPSSQFTACPCTLILMW